MQKIINKKQNSININYKIQIYIMSLSAPQTNFRYSLHNVENYKTSMQYSTSEILNKYNLLITEYLNFIIESINAKNNAYKKFVILRGLKTITHVFNIILYYTKNLDVAYYHSQKSFYFYIEFIGQISEDQHTFLQLNSRDAMMFVYKKTIYEINNEIKKQLVYPTADVSVKLDTLNMNITILTKIISYMVNGFDFLKENKKDSFKLFIKKIEKIGEKLNNEKINNDAHHTIYKFTDTICNNDTDNILEYSTSVPYSGSATTPFYAMAPLHLLEKHLDIIELFIKKYCKGKMNSVADAKINNNLIDLHFTLHLEDSSDKFISWIFT